MGSSEQKKFMKQYRDYLEEQGKDLGVPTFAKKGVDQFKLWVAVQELGGHAEVMANKGWARVGRLFEPPKSMTDLSFRIRKLYESHMLPFEKAVLKGEIEGDVYMPPRLEQPSAAKAKASKPRTNKRSSAPLPPRSQPKRAKKSATPLDSGDGLVGRRLRVLWPEEGEYFTGTVAAYDAESDKHKVEYDDGDEEMEDLAVMAWEFLDDDGTNQGGGSGLAQEGDEEQISSDDGREGDGEQDGDEDPMDACCVCQGPSYKVYQSDDKSAFEIFCLAPGLQVEEISVKCWDNGKLVVAKVPKKSEANRRWGVSPSKHKILLPRPVHATTARAVVTLHGQLYINVTCQSTASAEPASEPTNTVAEQQGSGAAGDPEAEEPASKESGGFGAESATDPQEHQHSTSPHPQAETAGEEPLSGADPPKEGSQVMQPGAPAVHPPKLEQSSSQV